MNILISISEGHIVRNLLENGLLEELVERDFRVTLLTPAYSIAAFRERWSNSKVQFDKLLPFEPTRLQRRMAQLRRRIARRGGRRLSRMMMERERSIGATLAYEKLIESCQWSVVLATHIHLPLESPLLNAAYAQGIPTVGIVNSWDNVYKGINAHPDYVAVWSDVNKKEMIEFEGYVPDKVIPLGVPAFDVYFHRENIWSREAFCEHFDLDPNRPIILYATIGQYVRFFEETFLLDTLLRGIEESRFAEKPQIVCRLHPWTKTELFSSYQQHPDVRLSRYENHVPTLGWSPTHEEVVLAANLLHHSAVCVTPGSTMALEAAIFDTPTLIPIFNNYQPEVWEQYYAKYCLAWHFGRLVREQMLPVVRNEDDLFDWINRYCADPSLFHSERARIVREYVQYTDGKAVKRLADLVYQVATSQSVELR